MSGILLNVGCGSKIYGELYGYKCINIDMRKLKIIDVTADVTTLPIKSESVEYIYASDILEHFPIAKTNDILIEWRRILKIDGILEIKCPNLISICKRYINNEDDTKTTSWRLYGGQGYKLNFHYVGFDHKWLESILREQKFDPFDYQELEVTNMILKGRKLL